MKLVCCQPPKANNTGTRAAPNNSTVFPAVPAAGLRLRGGGCGETGHDQQYQRRELEYGEHVRVSAPGLTPT